MIADVCLNDLQDKWSLANDVAALNFGDFYNSQYVKMYTIFILQLQGILPTSANIPEAYAQGSSEEQNQNWYRLTSPSLEMLVTFSTPFDAFSGSYCLDVERHARDFMEAAKKLQLYFIEVLYNRCSGTSALDYLVQPRSARRSDTVALFQNSVIGDGAEFWVSHFRIV
ncbi:hypothetical protein POM88_020429 [Heracleum sosnowskyi]|uniref:Uncharacterized protein n=1 Tax=Heracleum sosnowskyi TaxID=360622 RepID=A0AAD8ICT4_9APIA|nr:hypothetical protein POM88_020429 [Heracleum sosnowskyi]